MLHAALHDVDDQDYSHTPSTLRQLTRLICPSYVLPKVAMNVMRDLHGLARRHSVITCERC